MKISRENWLAQGLELLAIHGPAVIKIDRLCAQMKVTKGSFYHYFANRQAFIDELLAYWLNQGTEEVIKSLADIADPVARSDALNAIIFRSDLKPEVALRFWAREEPAVAKVVTLVDQRRLDYLTDLISEQTGPVDRASDIAKLAYAHFVGCQVLGDLISQEEWVNTDRLLTEMVLNQLGSPS